MGSCLRRSLSGCGGWIVNPEQGDRLDNLTTLSSGLGKAATIRTYMADGRWRLEEAGWSIVVNSSEE
jgi:hypothetical protein